MLSELLIQLYRTMKAKTIAMPARGDYKACLVYKPHLDQCDHLSTWAGTLRHVQPKLLERNIIPPVLYNKLKH